MPRPTKLRRVRHAPPTTYFKPRGIPLTDLEQNDLTLDGFEALRLADLDALSQEEAASRMKISRATFGRIIETARRVVADALVHGKAIRIEGGNFRLGRHVAFHCRRCKRQWHLPSTGTSPRSCPRCEQKGWSP
jgi:uncharacterized protein